jgi:hypothetical protein
MHVGFFPLCLTRIKHGEIANALRTYEEESGSLVSTAGEVTQNKCLETVYVKCCYLRLHHPNYFCKHFSTFVGQTALKTSEKRNTDKHKSDVKEGKAVI